MKQFRDTPYYITEEGKVFRHYPKTKTKYYAYWPDGKLRSTSMYVKEEKWNPVKASLRRDGYLVFNFKNVDGKKFLNISSHQMVAECYVDGWFEGAEVDHIDCNKQNNHYTNLQWCTPTYNRKKGNNVNYPLFVQI